MFIPSVYNGLHLLTPNSHSVLLSPPTPPRPHPRQGGGLCPQAVQALRKWVSGTACRRAPEPRPLGPGIPKPGIQSALGTQRSVGEGGRVGTLERQRLSSELYPEGLAHRLPAYRAQDGPPGPRTRTPSTQVGPVGRPVSSCSRQSCEPPRPPRLRPHTHLLGAPSPGTTEPQDPTSVSLWVP